MPSAKIFSRVEEAAGDILPLFVVNGFDHAPVVLHFFDSSVGIVKQGVSRRGSGQYLSPTVGKEYRGVHKSIS